MAVAVGIDGDLVVVLAAIGACRQMFAAIFDPADGAAFTHRKPGEANFLRQQNSLVTKSPTDVRRYDANSALLDTETIGEAVTNNVRHLGAGIKRELVEPVIERRDHAASFKRGHALPGSRYFARHPDGCIER